MRESIINLPGGRLARVRYAPIADVLLRSSETTLCANRRSAEGYPEPELGAGAGLSGAPPTETGPKGLGNGGIIFRDLPTSRARAFGRGMLEVVKGVTALCIASTCAASEES